MEPEAASVALVTFTLIEGQRDEHGNVTAGGTGSVWMVPDGQAEYLKDQLHKLFGDPGTEVLLPAISEQAIMDIKESWPGAVKFTRDEDSS